MPGLFFVVVLEERHTLSNSSEYRTEEEKEGQTHSSHTSIDYLLAEASGCVIENVLIFQYNVQFLMKFINSFIVLKSTVCQIFHPCRVINLSCKCNGTVLTVQSFFVFLKKKKKAKVSTNNSDTITFQYV